MPNVIFIEPDGSEQNVFVELGTTVMEAGRDAGLGIEGTCGGCLSCATCHVFDKDLFSKTGAPGEDEIDMLDLAFDRQKRHDLAAKLRCQKSLMACVLQFQRIFRFDHEDAGGK